MSATVQDMAYNLTHTLHIGVGGMFRISVGSKYVKSKKKSIYITHRRETSNALGGGGRGAVGVEGRVWWRGLGNSSGKNSFLLSPKMIILTKFLTGRSLRTRILRFNRK